MAKKLRFKKLIINFEDDGSFKDGVILYQKEINGQVESRKKYNSLTINNMPFNKSFLSKVMMSIRKKAKEIEEVPDVS